MPQAQIEASQYFLYFDLLNGTSYDNVICLTDHDFSLTNSSTTTKTYCGTVTALGDQNSSVNFNGLIMINPDDGAISAPDIFTVTQDQTKISWKIARGTPIAGDITKSGHGYITNYSEKFSATNAAGFSGTLTVDGTVTQVIETGS